MALSNTATPKYYAQFREQVLSGELPINYWIELEMNRIEDLIANPGVYYDDEAIDGFIEFCENELTLTDGSDLFLLDSFKLWAEQLLSWFFYQERSVYNKETGMFERRLVKKRLINKQYIITARGSAKSMYASCIQSYFLTVDPATTHQITTL